MIADDDDDDDRPETSSALRGVLIGTWLGAALAVTLCALTFRRTYPGYSTIAAAGLVLLVTFLVVGRSASRRDGSWGLFLASVAFTGTLPPFIAVSLYTATRPLLASTCTVEPCYPTLAIIVGFGASSTLIPLVVSSVAAAVFARRGRSRGIAGVAPVIATFGIFVATVTAGVAAVHGFKYPTVDRYVESVAELGRIDGAEISAANDHSAPVTPLSTPRVMPLLWATWTYGSPARGRPCHLEIAGAGYDIEAVEVSLSAPSRTTGVQCPEVSVRNDVSRGILIVAARSSFGGRGERGDYVPAFVVNTKVSGRSGPLYASGDELARVAPARLWTLFAGAGALVAIAIVIARLLGEGILISHWRKAPIGTHRGDGWVAFEDDASPPLHVAGARDVPRGTVRVLGVTPGAATGYRSSGGASANRAIASDVASVEKSSRERVAASIVASGLVAVIAATPVATAFFMLLRG